MGLVSVLWVLAAYSLAFSPGNKFIGGLDWLGFAGVGQEPNPDLSATIPHIAYAVFQLFFAAITPALITGAFAERMKFSAFALFTTLWLFLVYAPLAHWVWAPGGWLRELRRARLRRRHRRAHELGLRRPGRRHRHRQAARVPQGGDGPAQPDPDHPRRRHPVVRLVRLQRRQRPGRQRPRRPGVHRHQHRHRRGRARLVPHRLPAPAQDHHPWRGLGRGRRPGRHHPGRRLRRPHGLDRHRPGRRHRLRLGGRPEVQGRLRRRARRRRASTPSAACSAPC